MSKNESYTGALRRMQTSECEYKSIGAYVTRGEEWGVL